MRLVKNIDGVVKGKHHEIRMAMCCMLTEGHLLLDDVPGTGKTTLAKAIAGSIAGSWKRVQFTPDLLPSDITGVMVYEQGDRHLPLPRGAGVHQRADRRRDQPRQPEDAVGAARGDGGAPGHDRRRVAPGAAPVLRDRHPEPEGLPGHVHAARRPARPLHDAPQPRLHRSQHRGAAARGVQPPPARRRRSARSPTPTSSRR